MLTNSALIEWQYCVCSIKYVCATENSLCFPRLNHHCYVFTAVCAFAICTFKCFMLARISLNGTENIQIIINLQPDI